MPANNREDKGFSQNMCYVSIYEGSAKRQRITGNCNIINRHHNLKMANRKTKEDNAECDECYKIFGEDDTEVGCDGGCQKWYHKECAGLATTELSALKAKGAT